MQSAVHTPFYEIEARDTTKIAHRSGTDDRGWRSTILHQDPRTGQVQVKSFPPFPASANAARSRSRVVRGSSTITRESERMSKNPTSDG